MLILTDVFCQNCRARPRDTRDPGLVLKSTFETVRELELHLNFFNLVFAGGLWGWKLALLSNTILSGFSAIRLIHTNPVMGGLYIYSGVACVVNYTGMFQFAYKVGEGMESLKRMMEIQSTKLVKSEERKYWTRVLRSIPRMGIKVGGFNRVEREAVPIYFDFSVKQIVSLLLAFK